MAKLLKPAGEKKDSIIYRNPEHVKKALRDMLVHYKGVQAEMERKLDMSSGTLSKVFNDKIPVTQKFLDYIEERTKRKIPLEPPTEATVREAMSEVAAKLTKVSFERIMNLAQAAELLTEEDEKLLETLIVYRVGAEANVSPRKLILAIQDIVLLKGLFK